MNVLQFLASLVGSLAWPITIVVLVYLLRVPLVKILLTLTRLRYKDLELDFGREIKQLEKDARALDIDPKVPPASLIPPPKGARDLIGQAIMLTEDYPSPAIGIAWQAVEEGLMAAVMRLQIPVTFPHNKSALNNAELLHKHGVIDIPTFDILNRLRRLRNKVTHDSTEVVTANQAEEFVSLAWGLVDRLETLKRN